MKKINNQSPAHRSSKAFHSLLGLVIPDANGPIHRAGGNEGFADASG